uniref:RBPJ-interacting and tubulin-associated protein 1 n=1 Tax=Ciona savignyi TaxID=51511 RepID=H2YE04_CIOSA
MDSRKTPFTLTGKQIITPSPKTNKLNAYRTKASSSGADETLFGIPTRYAQQVETKRSNADQQWDPPWITSPTKTGAPLLWTPFQYKQFDGSVGPVDENNQTQKPRTPRSARTPNSNKYRLKKHTPTYVDETLFGTRLKDPSVKVSWNSNNGNNAKRLLWSPDMKGYSPRSTDEFLVRPVCPLGVYDDPYV